MNWYKKAQVSNVNLVLMIIMQKASQPGYMFESELLTFQDYEPNEIENAIKYVLTQFPEMNEQQQNIIWHLQRMLNGTDFIPERDNNDQEMSEGISSEEQGINRGGEAVIKS